jgi:alkylation response protein AidB-like acyl-CoA dehydrogenase
MFDGLVMTAQMLTLRGKPAIKDPVIRDRLAQLEARMMATEYHGYRLLTMEARGEDAGIAGMVTKLFGTQLGYDITKTAMDVGRPRPPPARPTDGHVVYALWSLGIPIAGGTANIQRNVIAERGSACRETRIGVGCWLLMLGRPI